MADRNHQLRARREATSSPTRPGMHLSRAELADAVNAHVWETTGKRSGLDAETIGRYERGMIRWPGVAYRTGLRAVLEVDDDADLGFYRTGRGRPSSSEPHVDRVDGTDLLNQLSDLESQYDRQPAAALLDEAARLLAAARPAKARTTDALAAEARAATLLGKIVWDASERRDAISPNKYFHQAATTAALTGDRVSEAAAWLRSCFVALYTAKSPATALRLAWRAADTAASSSPVLAGLSMLHAAEALAMMGIASDTNSTVAEAEGLLGRAQQDDPAAAWWSPGTLERMTGSIHLSLGNGKQAETILQAAMGGIRQGSKAQAIVIGNIALARIHQKQPDGAAVALAQAIDVLETTRGGGGLAIAFQAGRELAPWADRSDVREVRERLFTLVAP